MVSLAEWKCELCSEWIEPDDMYVTKKTEFTPFIHSHISCADAFFTEMESLVT